MSNLKKIAADKMDALAKTIELDQQTNPVPLPTPETQSTNAQTAPAASSNKGAISLFGQVKPFAKIA